jgi:N-acyl-L-homoserine lactone synthetase
MLYLIEPDTYAMYREDLDNMYRFRHKIFFDKLNWEVNSQDGMEKDQFDERDTYYLIYKDENGIIRGCVRFIEMVNECMFDRPFKSALPNVDEFKRAGYWEVSRFAVDTNIGNYYKEYMNKNIARILWSGVIDFSIRSKKVECYLALTYLSFKKLSEKYGLFIYDLNKINLNGDQMFIWAFPPMSYSFNKLMKNLECSSKSKIICNLNSDKYENNFIYI